MLATDSLKQIVYDGDPGIDDALAILLALTAENANLTAITTVAGNTTVDKAVRNVLKILSLLGRENDVEPYVGLGASKPLLSELQTSERFHGPDGLGDTEDLFRDLKFQELLGRVKPGVDLIVKSVLENPEPIVLVTAGPLTNLALAVRIRPEIVSKLKEVVVMGGAVREPGNVTMAAEFNIHTDPQAAKIVFNSGLPITLVSLDVTTKEQNTLTLNHLSQIEKADTPISRFISRIARYRMKTGGSSAHVHGCFLHDPLAVAIAIDKSLVRKSEEINVDVETEGKITLGKTQADLRRYSEHPPNLTHCVEVDSPRFLDMFLQSLSNYRSSG